MEVNPGALELVDGKLSRHDNIIAKANEKE
jgi:hypothetical protein